MVYHNMTSTIYDTGIIQRDVELSITEIDSIPVTKFFDNLKKYVETKLNLQISGKCMEDGYIKPNSVIVTNISAGEVKNYHLRYSVTCTCQISSPLEGMIIQCVAQTITQGGIKAAISEYPDDSPMVVFIARELSASSIRTISEADVFTAKIVGVHFELNDPYISVIAKVVTE